MLVFTLHHNGVYMSGNSVVVAETKRKAVNAINRALKAEGLKATVKESDLIALDTTKPSVEILFNGDY